MRWGGLGEVKKEDGGEIQEDKFEGAVGSEETREEMKEGGKMKEGGEMEEEEEDLKGIAKRRQKERQEEVETPKNPALDDEEFDEFEEGEEELTGEEDPELENPDKMGSAVERFVAYTEQALI